MKDWILIFLVGVVGGGTAVLLFHCPFWTGATLCLGGWLVKGWIEDLFEKAQPENPVPELEQIECVLERILEAVQEGIYSIE